VGVENYQTPAVFYDERREKLRKVKKSEREREILVLRTVTRREFGNWKLRA